MYTCTADLPLAKDDRSLAYTLSNDQTMKIIFIEFCSTREMYIPFFVIPYLYRISNSFRINRFEDD